MKLRSVMTVLALGAAAPAFAADPVNVKLSGFMYGGSEQAKITIGGAQIGGGVSYRAGGYKAEIFEPGSTLGSSFLTFCTDVYQTLNWGTIGYQRLTVDETKDLWGPGTSYNENSYGLVSKLFTTAYTSVNNSTKSAAFQYALWELLYENTGTYTILDDSVADTSYFSLTNTDAAARRQANTWLAAVIETNASEGYVVQSLFNGTPNPSTAGKQDLVIATPVPEPQTYALALVSLGIVAGYARRKRNPS